MWIAEVKVAESKLMRFGGSMTICVTRCAVVLSDMALGSLDGVGPVSGHD